MDRKGSVISMKKQYLDLMQFFEGYVKNYRKLNLMADHNVSMFTKREIDYFANLGEMLGFAAFIEESKPNSLKKTKRMDLSWWKEDLRKDIDYYLYLVLHLERESSPKRDEKTIEDLFLQTDEAYTPHNAIGIQFIDNTDRIKYLNNLVIEKNKIQKSNVLMIYRYPEPQYNVQRVHAHYFTHDGKKNERLAICTQDQAGGWYMCFDEDYGPFHEK